MEGSANTTASSKGKIRILVKAKMHLVPGNDRGEKLDFMKNVACQYLWQRDFDREQERCNAYNDNFGLEDCTCYFLIDHFGHDHATPDEQMTKPPIVWFEWTGESLNQILEELPRRIRRELRTYPFTWEGRSWHPVPKEPDGTYHPLIFRRKIQSCLRLGTPVLDDFIEFVGQYPQHARWLRDNLEEHLWLQLEPYCNLTDTETRDTNPRDAIGGNAQ